PDATHDVALSAVNRDEGRATSAYIGPQNAKRATRTPPGLRRVDQLPLRQFAILHGIWMFTELFTSSWTDAHAAPWSTTFVGLAGPSYAQPSVASFGMVRV